jgi:cytochrome c553
MFRVLLLALCLVSLAAPGREPDGGMQARLAACSACHGEDGEGKAGNEYYPHLAGKPSGYLLDQLRAFREGRRQYPQMNWLMRNMGDDYLERIARHYAALPPRSSAETVLMPAAAAARARQLVEQGDAARGVPACSACHGTDLAGLEPGVPALLGLPPDYTIAQLGAWRTQVRTAVAPDCMAEVAKALAPEDLRPLAEWLASQGVQDSPMPAPAGSFTLPVACGTLPTSAAPP